MNLKEIEYIVTLAQEQKLTRAAEKLFITPSALTQQVTNRRNGLAFRSFTVPAMDGSQQRQGVFTFSLPAKSYRSARKPIKDCRTSQTHGRAP